MSYKGLCVCMTNLVPLRNVVFSFEIILFWEKWPETTRFVDSFWHFLSSRPTTYFFFRGRGVTTQRSAVRCDATRQTWPVQVPCPIAPRDRIPREGSPHLDYFVSGPAYLGAVVGVVKKMFDFCLQHITHSPQSKNMWEKLISKIVFIKQYNLGCLSWSFPYNF